MKKLLFILPFFLFTLAVNAQTEDEVYIGKGKTFGSFIGRGAKPVEGQTTITGIVLAPRGPGSKDSISKSGGLFVFQLKKEDGTIITVGTRDNGFTVPRVIVGKTVSVEGKDADQISGRKRRDGVQFIAIGIMVID